MASFQAVYDRSVPSSNLGGAILESAPESKPKEYAMAKGLTVFAALLIAIGVAAYAASGAASVTALIPAFFGVPVGICAAVAAARPTTARGCAIAAAGLGLLGLLGILGRLLPPVFKGEFTWNLAASTQIAMAAISAALVAWVALAARTRGGAKAA